MRKLSDLLLFIAAFLFSCNSSTVSQKSVENVIVIENVEVSKKEITLNQIEGKWYYNNEPFSGYAQRFYENGALAEKNGFHEGKREGIVRKWSENGILKMEYYYKENRIVGIYKTWWENEA